MEILAPAGSVNHFIAALEAGADSVYVGAPFLNARNPAKELRFEEIAAMVDHARNCDKRIYVALNSLVKEDDLPRLIQTLSELEAINPHGLIVQDLGVIELIRRYFKSLRVHASTLMFAHNRNDVELLADLGCSRIVLARELSLKEIESIVRSSRVEIEVFVHGAMCFSYSGRCLFSSYHGGKSGLRGNCVQPCRRKFSVGSVGTGARGGKSGKKSGYVFSMNDLEGIDFIDEFKQMGVASIKIEGRLKPITYVQHVVRAYRMVLDADSDEKQDALVEARSLLEASLGRKRSTGYFLSSAPKDAIVSSHSGNIGTYLGMFTGFTHSDRDLWGTLNARESCREGDRLRLHFDKSGERTAFTAKQVERRDGGQTAVLLPGNLSKKHLQGRVDLYRVDTVKPRRSAADAPAFHMKIKPFSAKHVDIVRKRSNMVWNRLASTNQPVQTKTRGGKQQSPPPQQSPPSRQSRSSELWIRFDTVKPIYQKLPFIVDRYIIPINKKNLAETGHLSRYFGKNRNCIIWALPPVVYDQKSASLQRDVNVLIRSGFRSFQVSTIGQFNLFNEKNISLFGDYSLNVLNSRTMRMMTEFGMKGFQFSIETDRAALKRAVGAYRSDMDQSDSARSSNKHKNGLVGLTVYGAPPLFMSRVHAQDVSFKQRIISPKQEGFVIQKVGGESFTRPLRPFSLLPYRKELEMIGIDYMIIDLSGLGVDRRALEDLTKRIVGKERTTKLPTFNFEGSLA